jgi:hypothetical protein
MADALRKPLFPAETGGPRLTIAVTGASGYLAGTIVRRLLAAGHTVHGTVRDPGNAAKVGHLLAMPGAAERLKLFKVRGVFLFCFLAHVARALACANAPAFQPAASIFVIASLLPNIPPPPTGRPHRRVLL